MNNVNTLDNKLKVVTSSMPHMESVAIGIWIRMGARYEEKRYCGISHFIEHMLFKGTHSRDARQLKQSIEGVGGHFNGFTSEELTCYLVKVPARHMPLGLDILSDMVLYPRMEEREIEKECHVICEEIKMYRDQPASYVHEILGETMWPEHQLGRPITGFESTVKNFNKELLLDIKSKFYQPCNMAIVATGKIQRSDFLKRAYERFNMRGSGKRIVFEKFKNKQRGSRLKLHFKDTEQTHIAIGFHSCGRKSRDRYAVGLMNIILGGNMSSRLFEELREKRGLCYDISSAVKKHEETGGFFIHAGVDNRKVKETLSVIMNELSMIKMRGVGIDELRRAKEFHKGQLLLALEDTGSRMLWLGDQITIKNEVPTIKSIIKNIERVTTEDVRRVANYVFRRELLNLAAIGPESRLKTMSLEKDIDLK